MVTSASSNLYARLAVESFLLNTKLTHTDLFVLIDNDRVYDGPNDYRVNLLRPNNSQTFSQNLNLLISIAKQRDDDLVFLSNDVILTPGWLEPLIEDSAITIPTCNQTHKYSHNGLTLVEEMDIENFLGKYKELCEVVEYHKQTVVSEIFERFLMPFYAFRLPKAIYNEVGFFDENFINGGEDIDYRIRTLLKGFEVRYKTKSYLLHFNGKSTWRGNENSDEIQLRDKNYRKYFEDKWNSDLKGLLLTNEIPGLVLQKYNLLESSISFNDAIKLVWKLSNQLHQ